MDDAIDTPAPDEGSTQQAAELSALEFEASAEDYQPANDPAMSEAPQEGAAEMDTGEMVASLLGIGFGLVASRRGDHWALNEDEARETGQAIGAVLDKYFPDLSQQGVEVTAVMTCAMVLTPRLMADRQIEQQAAERQKIERKREAANEASEEGAGGDQPQSAA